MLEFIGGLVAGGTAVSVLRYYLGAHWTRPEQIPEYDRYL